MGVLEIVSGVVLILCSVAIVGMVLMQESKGNGLSGSIGGGESMMNDGRTQSAHTVLAKYTKYAATAFFVFAILVSIFSVYTK